MDPTRDTTPPAPEQADADVVEAMLAADLDALAHLSIEQLAEEAGTTITLLEAIQRTGILLPHHVDTDGIERFSPLDVAAVRNGLELIEAGLPLAEFLGIAAATDVAITDIADRAVDAFLDFIRDPALGAADDSVDLSQRLLTAYARMLPAAQALVGHHLRRRLMVAVLARFAQGPGATSTPTT